MPRRGSETTPPQLLYWTDTNAIEEISSGRSLVIADERPFVLHFGLDGWQGVIDRPSYPFAGVHCVILQRGDLRGRTLNFTRFYPSEARWEGVDHAVRIGHRRKANV